MCDVIYGYFLLLRKWICRKSQIAWLKSYIRIIFVCRGRNTNRFHVWLEGRLCNYFRKNEHTKSYNFACVFVYACVWVCACLRACLPAFALILITCAQGDGMSISNPVTFECTKPIFFPRLLWTWKIKRYGHSL